MCGQSAIASRSGYSDRSTETATAGEDWPI